MRLNGGSSRMDEEWLFEHEHPAGNIDDELDRDSMDLREWAFLRGFYGDKEDVLGVDDF